MDTKIRDIIEQMYLQLRQRIPEREFIENSYQIKQEIENLFIKHIDDAIKLYDFAKEKNYDIFSREEKVLPKGYERKDGKVAALTFEIWKKDKGGEEFVADLPNSVSKLDILWTIYSFEKRNRK